MKLAGPDSLNSWLICLACCFINMTMFGISRLSGVLFVATIDRFKVNRQQASLPYTFSVCLRCLSGPLVGLFGHKFGVRAVTSCGALIGAIGVALCFFAESITAVIFVWGICFGGFAFGFGSILVPISINQYFDKHRATASGVSFSGSCLGSFILPPILDILLDNYGLSQTYLILSGFILNCIPAALLLRKPSFKIKIKSHCDDIQIKGQNLVQRTKETSYDFERDINKPEVIQNPNSMANIMPINNKTCIQNHAALTHEESLKHSLNQTLLANDSVHMGTSKMVNDDKILENENKKRHVDLNKREEDTSNLSSEDTFQDGRSQKDYCLDKEITECEQKSSHFIESDNIICEKIFHNREYDKCEISQNSLSGINENQNLNNVSNNTCQFDCSGSFETECIDKQHLNCSFNNQDYSKTVICPQACEKKSSQDTLDYSNKLELTSEDKIEKITPYLKNKKQSTLSAFRVIFDPMFVLIAFSMAIYNSTFICMVTIIVDYSRDLHIEASYEKYILMLLSVGDITGRLGLGWVIDRGYITTSTFSAACFASQSLVTATIVFSKDFTSLAILITLYGFTQAGLIFIFPVIIAQYIERDKQTVAISSSHFLSGPLCLAVAPLIGYFRDEIGAYDWIFHGIAMVSAITSMSWMFAVCIEKRRRKT